MAQALNIWSVALLVSVCGLVQGLVTIDPLVSTKNGVIRGQRTDYGSKFMGVPYGVVDENNPFGPSVPHPGFDKVFEANEYKVCPQLSNGDAVGTIDCLTINIYVPSTASSQNRLPVMVWIHGGAYLVGSANGDSSNPTSLLRNDVIVVGINYRLGAYGFMCLDIPEVPGNQGLKDQVLALRWINENIEAFGGDASQITAFGESAGGISLNLHLYSLYEKLFERVIIQSGPALSPWVMMETDTTVPLRLAEELGFYTTDIRTALAYLSTVDAHTLIRVSHESLITNSVTTACLEKKIEGVDNFLTDHPINLNTSKVRTTPIIIGYNDNEAAMFYETENADFFSTLDFNEFLSQGLDLDNNSEASSYLRLFYFGDEKITENVRLEFTDFASDFLFNHPTQRMAEQFLDNGAETVYRYLFSYSGGRNVVKISMNLNSTGATHVDELGYLFEYDMFSGETTPEDQLVIDRMTTLWTNFVKYGNPIPETSELLPVQWDPITKTKQPYLEIDSDLTIKSRPFNDRMAFWDVFYKLYRNQQKWYKGGNHGSESDE